MVLFNFDVNSGLRCPFCGEEMTMMSGAWYYDNCSKLVNVECRDCGLEVTEYDLAHREEDTDQEPYFALVKRLRSRLLAAGWKEVEGSVQC